MTAASTRPRDVALASVLTIIASVLALAGIFGAQGELHSSSVRRQVGELLTDQRFATVDLSVDTLLNVIRYGLMAAAAASVAAIVLAVFVMRGHNPSRIALTVLGAFVAMLMLFSGLTGVVTAVFVAYTVSLLWRAPVRSWFATAAAPGPAGEGPREDAGGPGAYWGMSGTGPGGSGSDAGSGGEPEPSRNPDAVPDPDPHWPSDPASPGSGPGPYPRPWPPEPDERGRPEQPGRYDEPEQPRRYGQPDQPPQYGQSGQYGQYGQSQPPDENRPQPGQQPGQRPGDPPGPQPGGPSGPGYPGPNPAEQQPAYGYPPVYPSGGQGHPGGVSGYPGGGYPYASSHYGYPPASGDPYRRPAQVTVAHVLTWVGVAFGLVTGVFFVVAANSTEVLNLVEEQLGGGAISRDEFRAALVAAGIITALWSLAVAVVSLFSWRGQNWAAILLTVMGGGYLLVQLFTLLMGQIPVLFTIVWVAAVLALLWWPASRQWYAARRAGQHGQGPQGPQGPYGGPRGPGSPYPQSPPPHRNQPW